MYRLILILLLFTAIWYSCNAPRNNPLDPKNDDYEFGSLSGIVQTYRVPHQPISDCEIFWKNAERYTYTDAQGRFIINEIDPVDGWLYIRANQYFDDSVHVEWTGKNEIEIQPYLNAVPILDSLVLYSSILNLYNDLQLIRLSIKTAVSDPDNDIDTVFVLSPGLNIRRVLAYDLKSQLFVRELSMQDLGISSPEAVIGHDFEIFVKDRLSNCIKLTSSVIKRIIKEQVNLKTPGGHEVVNPNPELSWEPVAAGFPLTYRVEIYSDEMNLVWFKDELHANSSSILVDTPLPADKYRWAIWIIDEFENRSRSKYKSFEVQSNE